MIMGGGRHVARVRDKRITHKILSQVMKELDPLEQSEADTRLVTRLEFT